MRPSKCRIAIAVSLLALGAALSLPVRAQEKPAPPPPVNPFAMWKRALALLKWDSAKRGSLLIANAGVKDDYPTESQLSWDEIKRQNEAVDAHAGREITLREMANIFHYEILTVGTLTILAPSTMTVLKPHPPRPEHSDPYARLDPSYKSRLLMASLTPEQWRLLGGAGGLGMNDLNPDQHGLFLSLLPDPLGTITYNVETKRSERGGSSSTMNPVGTPNYATSAQRLGTRLHLNLQARYFFVQDSAKPRYLENINPQPDNYTIRVIVSKPAESRAIEQGTLAGVPFVEIVGNRLKPGDLNFDAAPLQVPVSLTGAATVGELVERVAAATHIEMYADRRVSLLPVFLSGDSARAGDLLKALCRGTLGAIRRLGDSTYLMTDDREGLPTRNVRLARSLNEAIPPLRLDEGTMRARLQQSEAAKYLQFAADDPLVLPPTQLEKLLAVYREGNGGRAVFTLNGDELPPAVRKRKEEAVSTLSALNAGRAISDKVGVSLAAGFTFQIPGLGTFNPEFQDTATVQLDEFFHSNPIPTPTDIAPIPANLKTRALMVGVLPDDDLPKIIVNAQALGLNQIWVLLPDDEKAADAYLQKAIAAGQAAKMPVTAVTRLLSRPPLKPRETAPPEYDRNFMGETESQAVREGMGVLSANDAEEREETAHLNREWLQPRLPSTVETVKQRLLTLAATPGLVAIVVRDIAPPGYTADSKHIDNAFRAMNELGYTPEMRLAFVRQFKTDPVDLDTGNGLVPISPFYVGYKMERDDLNPRSAWRGFRNTILRNMLADVQKAVRAQSNLPLFVQSAESMTPSDIWYASWDKPEMLPTELDYIPWDVRLDNPSRADSKILYRFVSLPLAAKTKADEERTKRDIQWHRKYLARAIHWDGFVCDATKMTAEEIRQSLIGFFTPAWAQ